MRLTKSLLAALALVATVPTAASAASVFLYSSRSSFLSEVGPVVTETFNSCGGTSALGVGQSLSNGALGPCGAIASDIAFAPGAGGELYIAGPGHSTNPTTALGVNNPNGGPLVITFAGGTDALGVDLFRNFGGGSQGSGPALFRFKLFYTNGISGSINTSDPFKGFRFEGVSLERVEISLDNGYAVIDNVAFQTTGSVPEPATWAMMIAGFGATGSMIRRRRTALA